MNATSTLSFPFESHNVRAVLRDGEPWFVAADVCAALTIGNSRMALGRLDDDERGVSSIDTPSGEQQMNLINESGLYSLILGSRKPEAKRFKKWVTSEVLPAIRKTGAYVGQREASPSTQKVLMVLDTASGQIVSCKPLHEGAHLVDCDREGSLHDFVFEKLPRERLPLVMNMLTERMSSHLRALNELLAKQRSQVLSA